MLYSYFSVPWLGASATEQPRNVMATRRFCSVGLGSASLLCGDDVGLHRQLERQRGSSRRSGCGGDLFVDVMAMSQLWILSKGCGFYGWNRCILIEQKHQPRPCTSHAGRWKSGKGSLDGSIPTSPRSYTTLRDAVTSWVTARVPWNSTSVHWPSSNECMACEARRLRMRSMELQISNGA